MTEPTSLHTGSRREVNRQLPDLPSMSDAWSEALFDRHPFAAVLIDGEGRVQRANASAHWLPLAGTPKLSALVPHQKMPSELVAALSARQPWSGPLQLHATDGRLRTVLAHILPSADMHGPRAPALCLFAPPSSAAEPGTTAQDDSSFRAMTDSAPVMIWLAAGDSMGIWFNQTWFDYTGRPPAELQGRGWMQSVHPEDLDRCLGIQATSYSERQPYSMDHRLRRHDGQYRWVLANGVPHHGSDGRFEGYVGICVDIHERKELEERLAGHMQTLRQADRRQNEFLAMLSHELRGPLAPIANVASVLRTLEDSNPKLARLREIVERQVGRMRRLVDDLVDVTRVMQGQVTLVKQAVSVAELLRSAIEATQAKLEAGGHTLRVDQPLDSVMVLGDAVRLSQALSNLLSNAAKFSQEPSEIEVKVNVSGPSVSISVCDKGTGIAPDFLPYVFDLFSHQDQPRVRALGGLGLGLPLARRVAQLHGGDVKAFSAGAGCGSEFVMSLPVMTASAPVEVAEPPTVPPRSPYRVLLIEDNPDTRYLLRLQIELWGNDVQTACDALEALRLAESFQPEIVLCDLSLPGLKGSELIREMSTQRSIARPLFVALAGHGRYEEEAGAKAAGFDAFLVKPLRPESLGQLFRTCAARTP